MWGQNQCYIMKIYLQCWSPKCRKCLLGDCYGQICNKTFMEASPSIAWCLCPVLLVKTSLLILMLHLDARNLSLQSSSITNNKILAFNPLLQTTSCKKKLFCRIVFVMHWICHFPWNVKNLFFGSNNIYYGTPRNCISNF